MNLHDRTRPDPDRQLLLDFWNRRYGYPHYFQDPLDPDLFQTTAGEPCRWSDFLGRPNAFYLQRATAWDREGRPPE